MPTKYAAKNLQQALKQEGINDFDVLTLEHLTSTLQDQPEDEDIIEAWSPFFVDGGAAVDEPSARMVCLGVLGRLRSSDSSTTASDPGNAGARVDQQSSEKDTPQDDDTIQGLSEWLAKLRLAQYEPKARKWCIEMGACDVGEVREFCRDSLDEFSEALGLKNLERKRIWKDVDPEDVGEAPPPSNDTPTNVANPPASGAPTVRSHQFGSPPYTCLQQLGTGMTATVYRCQRLEKNGEMREYAAKSIDLKKFTMHPTIKADLERVKEKIHRETLILFKLRHDHIVSLYNVVEENDKLYLVMELVDGGELADHIPRHEGLPEAEARFIFIQLIDAITYIHNSGIVHRDLKPENILVNKKNSREGYLDVKISDFGHSKLLDDGYSIPHTKVGTPQYWAPEVSDIGDKGYDEKVDLWSLGVVLYVMLEGVYPFDNASARIDEQIRNAAYSFNDPNGHSPSSAARELIRNLITVIPKDRLPLKECKRHPWVEGQGVNKRVLDVLGRIPAPLDDEESIALPSESCRGYKELCRDLQKFTNNTQFAAHATGKQGRVELVVNWSRANSASSSHVQEARAELVALLKSHFPKFSLGARGEGLVRQVEDGPRRGNQTIRAPHPQSPSVREGGAAQQGGAPTPTSSFRLVSTTLRVAENGAGLSLIPRSFKGMHVDCIEEQPGQPGIQVGDIIVKIANANLSSLEKDEINEVFGSHFQNNVKVTLKRFKGGGT